MQPFDRDVLALDPVAETERIVTHIRHAVQALCKKRGAVVGVSGGIDSAVTLALCARALGPGRVLGVLLQERESSPENVVLARGLARGFGVTLIAEEITAALEGFGCYRRRDAAICRVFPEYDSTYKAKITLPGNVLERDVLNLFALTVISPEGVEQTQRLPLSEYLEIVAATNLKQRTRMAMLYYHAEQRTYAVIGTANRNERELGFFVKHGDGGTDIDPIVHLYKSQVYQLAEHLGIPAEIRRRSPTSDTYSAPSSQDEFFFRLPFETLDLLWYAQEHGIAPQTVAGEMGLTSEQVERAYDDLARKRRATEYLRLGPLRLE